MMLLLSGAYKKRVFRKTRIINIFRFVDYLLAPRTYLRPDLAKQLWQSVFAKKKLFFNSLLATPP